MEIESSKNKEHFIIEEAGSYCFLYNTPYLVQVLCRFKAKQFLTSFKYFNYVISFNAQNGIRKDKKL